MRFLSKRFVARSSVILPCFFTLWFIYTFFRVDVKICYTQIPKARTLLIEIVDVAPSCFDRGIVDVGGPILTHRRYGKNIIYYDFSKIPDNLVLDKRIELPKDLKEYIDAEYNYLKIENPKRFEKEIWEEGYKLGYTPDKLKNATVKEAIMFAVEIVTSRFTYHNVDWDGDFIKKYGRYLPEDVYFHLKLGDCDKYRDSTIAVFNIIKKLNPQLQNVYLSREELGGNPDTYHAWVSAIILQDNYLILSHTDPTFYDSKGLLEADEFHICLKNDIFIVRFYRGFLDTTDYYACKYVYRITHETFLEIKSPKWRERLLDDMSFINYLNSNDEPVLVFCNALWILEQYEAEGFVKSLDGVLYYAYKACLETGKKLKAEKYRRRLLKEFPKSHWAKQVK